MINNPHRCVVDSNGIYVTFVLLMEQPDGSKAPYSYSLKSGESLLDASPPSNMITPRWISTAWEETASPEEIAAAEAIKAQEAGTVSEGAALPSLAERVEAVEDALLALALGGGIGV